MNTRLVDSLLEAILSLPEKEKALLTQKLSDSLRSDELDQTQSDQTQSNDLRHEPFVGMWQDREEMTDSTAWIRTLRQQQWMNSHAATDPH